MNLPIFNLLNKLFTLTTLEGVVKILIIIFLGVYLAFAIVVLRQVQLLAKILKTSLSPLLKIVALFHFLFALAILFMALAVL